MSQRVVHVGIYESSRVGREILKHGVFIVHTQLTVFDCSSLFDFYPLSELANFVRSLLEDT
jgi:hypothetical protein